MRLSLSAIDLAQPYSCLSSATISNPSALHLEWYVGGSFNVDATFLTLSRSVSFDRAGLRSYSNFLKLFGGDEELDTLLSGPTGQSPSKDPLGLKLISPVFHGQARWYENVTNPPSLKRAQSSSYYADSDPLSPKSTFSHAIPVDSILQSLKEPNSTMWLVIWAKVDQNFGKEGQGYPTELHPQSYFSNIRSNSHWKCHPTGRTTQRTCQGRRYWPSEFIELAVSSNGKLAVTGAKHCSWWNYTTILEASTQSAHNHKIGGFRPNFTTSESQDSSVREAFESHHPAERESWPKKQFVLLFVLIVVAFMRSLVRTYLQRSQKF